MGEHLTYDCKQNLSLITLKIIIFLSCLPTFPHVFLHFMLLLFTYLSVFVCECVVCVCVYSPSLLAPYGCRSNNVKHFALASFCNLQFPNVRPVESRSDNGHALPPVVFVPPYLPSINATAGVSCNNTCTSEPSAWERERRGRWENRGGNRGMRLRLGRNEEGRGETIKTGLGCHDCPVLCGHVNVACQLKTEQRGNEHGGGWWRAC